MRHSLTSFTLGPRLHLCMLIASIVSPGLCCVNSLELAHGTVLRECEHDPHIHAIDFIKLDGAAGVLLGECGECGFGVERALAAPEACESACRCKLAHTECCQRCRRRAIDTGSHGCSDARPMSPSAAHQGEARACRWARYQSKRLQLLP